MNEFQSINSFYYSIFSVTYFLPAIVMFQVKRIPDYARYLSDLLEETDPAHPDYEDLSKAAGRVTSVSHDSS